MSNNIYIYLLVAAGVTYLIRALPMTLIRKNIKNKFINWRIENKMKRNCCFNNS